MPSVQTAGLTEEHINHGMARVPCKPGTPRQTVRYESLLDIRRGAGNQAAQQLLRPSGARPLTVDRQDPDDDPIAERAGEVNAGSNVLGPMIEDFTRDVVAAEKEANELFRIAKAERVSAARRLNKAQGEVTNAARATDKAKRLFGGGRRGVRVMKRAASRTRNAKAATKEAVRQVFEAGRGNTRAVQALDEAKAARAALPGFVKLADRLPRDQIGFAAAAIEKARTTKNTTLLGKGADALGSASMDAAFSTAFPVVAAIDAGVGLIGGKRYTVSALAGDSVSSATGLTESVLTGDVEGISSFHEASKNGQNSMVFELIAESGEYWVEHGGSEERVQTTGDFYGGADSAAGRASAAIASVPGVGHAGQAGAFLAWQTYDNGRRSLSAAAALLEAADDFMMPEGRTLNPVVGIKSILRGENPF